jgi:cell fate regulator YaaT (PSP1 superfamily)
MADQQRTPVGVRFKEAGRVYYFDARGAELDVGSYVVVETSHGQEVGRVVVAPDQVIASEIKETLKPILRRAAPEDLERAADQKKRASEQLVVVRREAEGEGFKIHLVAGDYSLDGSQLTFYFTAEDRVDARSLTRTLSPRFDSKVQILQIGDRDRAKLIDGIGRCGERLCCSSWLSTFPTVSIKMAKEQSLPLNPSKLSGACGRLLCCLTYEYDEYREIKGGLPKVGAKISTPSGDVKVIRINVATETIGLAMAGLPQAVDMPIAEFRLMYGTALRPKELAEAIEKKLLDAGAAEAAARAPAERPPEPVAEKKEAPKPPEEKRPHRRRRRRGGRRRRKANGGS